METIDMSNQIHNWDKEYVLRYKIDENSKKVDRRSKLSAIGIMQETKNQKSVWLVTFLYVCGCLVSWKIRAQKSISLSSTEEEYVALSEVSIEIL